MEVTRKLLVLLLCQLCSRTLSQNYFDDYSEYDAELTPQKFLELEKEKQEHEAPVSHVKTVKDNRKRDYHEMIDSLIKDWYNPAKYLENGGYLNSEANTNDIRKEFLELEDSNSEAKSENSTSVFDKIKKTLKKVFKPSGYDDDESLFDGNFDVSLIEPRIDISRQGNVSVNVTTTTVAPPSTTANVTTPFPVVASKNDSTVLIEKYPKILRQFSEGDMNFLKHFLSCLKKSVDVNVNNKTTTVAPPTVKPTKQIVLKNDSVAHASSLNRNKTKVDVKSVKESTNNTKTDVQKMLNQTNFVLKCVPMKSSKENEMITFNCTKEPCFNVTYFTNSSNTTSPSLKNVTTPSNNNTKDSFIENKLKYLAHLHHPISMVGHLPQKPVDLANVQKIIDEAKYGMFPENDEETANDTTDTNKVSKRSRLTRDYYSDDDETQDYDANEMEYLSDYDELTGNKSRKSKKRHKGHSMSQHDHSHENPKEKETKVSPEPLDFSDIQLKLTPEQEMEILRFEENLNASPEPFHFDINKFIKEKSYEKPVEVSHMNEVTPKKYFEFAKPFNKRDLNTKFEAYKNLIRGNKETFAPVMSNYNDAYAKTYRKQLLSNSHTNNDENFIDNYYLLNDGNAQEIISSPKNVEKTPNLLDLDIDLRLNKEFQDLEYEKEKILQGEGDINDPDAEHKSYHPSNHHFNVIR